MTDHTEASPGPAGPAGWSPPVPSGWRNWVLFLLVVVYTSNFIDRTIVNIVGQAIKTDLKLTDTQLGLLNGPAFAIFYAVLGVGFGLLSDRVRRSTVITISLVLWSAFTAACGFALNFGQLFLLRMGVGVGEAGCSPAAQSLISDYYSPKSRSMALAIYSLGIPFGTLFGALAGGLIAQEFGWRQAFMVIGLPGLALALVCQFALKEPKRGAQDRSFDAAAKPPSPLAVIKRLYGNRSFPHIAIGASLGSMASYGIGGFVLPFLLRGPFGLDLPHAAFDYGIVFGLAMAAGVFLGGVVTDGVGRLSKRAYALFPGFGFLIAAPLFVWAFQQTDITRLATLVIAPLILQYLYLGPTFAVSHNLVTPRERATATALLFLPINLIGYGVGPALVGFLSDKIGARFFEDRLHDVRYAALCPGGKAAPHPPLDFHSAATDLAGACHMASFEGVKWAIIIVAGVVYAWAGIHYLLGSITLKRDLDKAIEGT